VGNETHEANEAVEVDKAKANETKVTNKIVVANKGDKGSLAKANELLANGSNAVVVK
jgi:hypothetical protein